MHTNPFHPFIHLTFFFFKTKFKNIPNLTDSRNINFYFLRKGSATGYFLWKVWQFPCRDQKAGLLLGSHSREILMHVKRPEVHNQALFVWTGSPLHYNIKTPQTWLLTFFVNVGFLFRLCAHSYIWGKTGGGAKRNRLCYGELWSIKNEPDGKNNVAACKKSEQWWHEQWNL